MLVQVRYAGHPGGNALDDHAHTKASGCCGCGGDSNTAAPVAVTVAKDPVCGMTVDSVTSKRCSEHEGTTYRFCCDGCRTKFEADPVKYVYAES